MTVSMNWVYTLHHGATDFQHWIRHIPSIRGGARLFRVCRRSSSLLLSLLPEKKRLPIAVSVLPCHIHHFWGTSLWQKSHALVYGGWFPNGVFLRWTVYWYDRLSFPRLPSLFFFQGLLITSTKTIRSHQTPPHPRRLRLRHTMTTTTTGCRFAGMARRTQCRVQGKAAVLCKHGRQSGKSWEKFCN